MLDRQGRWLSFLGDPQLVSAHVSATPVSGILPINAGKLAGVFVVATLLSLAVLWPMGLGNDQALFDYYAARMLSGSTLYIDIWDNKQPGIFLWYVLSESIFGPGWEGLRWMVAVWAGLSAVVVSALCAYVRPRTPAWWIAPIFTVGMWLLRSDAERPAQVESLLPLPLMLILALMLIEPTVPWRRHARWLLVGALTGCVAAFKLVLAPVAAAMIAVGLGWRLYRRLGGFGDLIGAGLLTVVGFLAVASLLVGYFHATGALDVLWWSSFVYPRLALADVPTQNISMWFGSLKWLFVTCIPFALAAAISIIRAVRSPADKSSLLVFVSLAWVVVGLVMFSLQKFSWWGTHMDLIDWPIGMFAALGLTRGPTLGEKLDTSSRFGLLLPACAAGLVIFGVAFHFVRFSYAELDRPDWPKPVEELRSLETARNVARSVPLPCKTVYAIGDQAGVERATGLRQALSTHGLWFGAFLTAQIERLPADLREAHPDLVYFDADHRRDFAQRSPATLTALDQWLESDYQPVTVDALNGRWWVRKDAAAPVGGCHPTRRFEIPVAAAR